MKEVRKLKQLQSQLNTMIADAEALKIEFTNKNREYSRKMLAIENLKIEMEKLNGADVLKVSEHAIVRYFERVKGFDLSEIEKEILSDKILSMVATLGGSGTYPNENGYSVLMKNHTVTTIV